MSPVPEYYFSKSEWDRLGCGPLPSQRSLNNQATPEKLRLEQHRDFWLPGSTYYYVDNNKVVSPYFDSLDKAQQWLESYNKKP